MENQFKKRSEYFPTHNISFQKEKAYLDNKLIFNSPMDMIYDYYYEIFVDVEKNKFLIITPIYKEYNDVSSVEGIIRNLIYIVPFSDLNNIYYSKLPELEEERIGGLRISSKKSFEYYGGGSIFYSIDLQNRQITLKYKKGQNSIDEEIEVKMYILE